MIYIQVAEIFKSIQGESTTAGRPCVFIRLAGCNLDCAYCDSVYAAKAEGTKLALEDIVSRVEGYDATLVAVTGGEPLAQASAAKLISTLCDKGYETLVETNGSIDLAFFDRRAKYIVDVKTPGSGAGGSFMESNWAILKKDDEIKFVITSRDDFDWAKELIDNQNLCVDYIVLFSPAWGMVEADDLAKWLLGSGLNARLNIQLHKYIWGPNRKGV